MFNFTTSIIIAVVMGFLCLFSWMAWKKPEFRRTAPALMTSLGILGTFLGIVLALWEIQESGKIDINYLLSLMSTAFITSCMGLFFALVTRSLCWAGAAESEPISRGEEELIKGLKNIKRSISGDSDANLVSQIENLREENKEGFSRLDNLAKVIEGALIKSMQTLIKDIRDIIARQLGESILKLIRSIEKAIIQTLGAKLDEFNRSVDQIATWQKQHQENMKILTLAFKEAASGIEKIKDDCAKIPPTMEKLRELVESANGQVEELNKGAEVFARMREQASQAFPEIDRKLKDVMDNLEKSAEGFQGLQSTIQESHKTASALVSTHAEETNKLVIGMRKDTETKMNEIHVDINSRINSISGDVNGKIDKMAESWGENLIAVAQKCADTIKAVEERK